MNGYAASSGYAPSSKKRVVVPIGSAHTDKRFGQWEAYDEQREFDSGHSVSRFRHNNSPARRRDFREDSAEERRTGSMYWVGPDRSVSPARGHIQMDDYAPRRPSESSPAPSEAHAPPRAPRAQQEPVPHPPAPPVVPAHQVLYASSTAAAPSAAQQQQQQQQQQPQPHVVASAVAPQHLQQPHHVLAAVATSQPHPPQPAQHVVYAEAAMPSHAAPAPVHMGAPPPPVQQVVYIDAAPQPNQKVCHIDVVSKVRPEHPTLFRLKLKGDLSKLPFKVVKQSLEACTGVPLDRQILEKDGFFLADTLTGGRVNLMNGSVLTLSLATAPALVETVSAASPPPPQLHPHPHPHAVHTTHVVQQPAPSSAYPPAPVPPAFHGAPTPTPQPAALLMQAPAGASPPVHTPVPAHGLPQPHQVAEPAGGGASRTFFYTPPQVQQPGHHPSEHHAQQGHTQRSGAAHYSHLANHSYLTAPQVQVQSVTSVGRRISPARVY